MFEAVYSKNKMSVGRVVHLSWSHCVLRFLYVFHFHFIVPFISLWKAESVNMKLMDFLLGLGLILDGKFVRDFVSAKFFSYQLFYVFGFSYSILENTFIAQKLSISVNEWRNRMWLDCLMCGWKRIVKRKMFV